MKRMKKNGTTTPGAGRCQLRDGLLLEHVNCRCIYRASDIIKKHAYFAATLQWLAQL